MRASQAATMRGASLKPVIFPALAALIRHPSEGWILFDTGYDRRFIEATRPFPERLYRWLTPLVIPPEEEAGGAAHRGGDRSGRGAPPDPVALPRRSCRGRAPLRQCDDPLRARRARRSVPARTPRRAHRGDAQGAAAPRHSRAWELLRGRARALPWPPTCCRSRTARTCSATDRWSQSNCPAIVPGHWGLVVRTEDAPEFLVADAAWSSEAIRRDVPPPRLVANLLGDASRGRETLHRLHLLRTRNPEIVLTPSHCGERAAART